MELDIECTPIMPTTKTQGITEPNKPSTFNISKAKFYCFIKGYPYIVLVPHAIAFTTGINLLTILICSLSMIAIEWTWITWSILLIQLFSYNLTALINPGTPRNTGNTTNNCKICNGPMTKDSVHCFKCGICVEKYDHHCSVIGKCIGKRNIVIFYTFIVATGLLWWYIILSIIYIIYKLY